MHTSLKLRLDSNDKPTKMHISELTATGVFFTARFYESCRVFFFFVFSVREGMVARSGSLKLWNRWKRRKRRRVQAVQLLQARRF